MLNNLVLKRNEKLESYSELRLQLARIWNKDTSLPNIIEALGSIPNNTQKHSEHGKCLKSFMTEAVII